MESKCVVHNERDVAARCIVCRRPMCSECAKQTEDGTFCSASCREKYVERQAKVKEFKEKEAALSTDNGADGVKALITKVLVFLGLVIIVIVVWSFLPPKMHSQVSYAIDQILKNWGFKKH
jgi:hypothetical protein